MNKINNNIIKMYLTLLNVEYKSFKKMVTNDIANIFFTYFCIPDYSFVSCIKTVESF